MEETAQALLQSDIDYFEAGAALQQIDGATIASMEGLQNLAAGCLISRVASETIHDANAWIDRIESGLRECGARQFRLYTSHARPELEMALMKRGYARRVELGVIKDIRDVGSVADVTLAQIVDEAGWNAKLSLYRNSDHKPDGYDTPAEQWVEMERRKCAAGYMIPYLIMANGEIAGTVNAADAGILLRLKNLFVHPEHRRLGVASATLARFAMLAGEANKLYAGAFVIEPEPFIPLYTASSWNVCVRQTEWVRPLPSEEEMRR